MITLRTNMKQNMFLMVFFTVLIGLPPIFAEPILSSTQEPTICDPKCGCDGLYIYDNVKEDCVLNLPKLMKRVMKRYDNHNDDDIMADDGMAKSIYVEGQKIFRGIMISVLFFLSCATLCVLSACIYCCRINYTDQKLKHDVKVLAKKMNKNYTSTKESTKPKAAEPKSETCNVVVEQAGVFVV